MEESFREMTDYITMRRKRMTKMMIDDDDVRMLNQ